LLAVRFQQGNADCLRSETKETKKVYEGKEVDEQAGRHMSRKEDGVIQGWVFG
jgi:hypothetical protein